MADLLHEGWHELQGKEPPSAGLTAQARGVGIARHGTWLALLAFGVVAVVGILARPVLPVDETRYLSVAWEMRAHGNWLVPHLNGAVYSHKPPLLFWLINLVWSVTGVSAFAARLVGPAFGLATIAATAGLARRLWPEDAAAGGRAALVLAGFAASDLYAGLTMFDTMLALAVVLGVRALVATETQPRAWIGLSVALAFGALAKGPVILVHLLPIALATPLWRGESWRVAALRTAKAVALALLIVSLWLIPASLFGGPEYRDAVLWTQSAGRIADPFAHGRPLWWFLPLLPLLLWPWAWSGRLWRDVAGLGFRRDPGLRLALLWSLSALLLFSLIASKQLHYLLPALPAVALIFARAGAVRAGGLAAVGLLPLMLGVTLLAAALGFGPADMTALARPVWGILLPAALLLALAGAGFVLKGPRAALLGPGLVLALDLLFLHGAPGRIYNPDPIARIIASRDGAIAICSDRYQGEFSFAARLREPVLPIGALQDALHWLDTTPDAILVCRMDGSHPETGPAEQIDFNGHPYGLWTSGTD